MNDYTDADAADATHTIEHNLALLVRTERSNGALGRLEADEALRERQLDEMTADVVEVVRRQRTRLGRKVCSAHDGQTIRKITALLKAMSAEITADNDPSFGEQ